MKKTLFWTVVLLLGCLSCANAECILDHQNGNHYSYDLFFQADKGCIYDIQRDAVIHASRTGDRTILYDPGTESFYEIRQTGPDTYVGYDHATGTTQEFQVQNDGTIWVSDPETGEWFRFTGTVL